MKLVAIAGSIAKDSYNKKLVNFMAKAYSDVANIEVLSLDQVPLFDRDLSYKDFDQLVELDRKIKLADGVILATPEHNHTTTVAMKSMLEWLSTDTHPFQDKPVLIVGASYHIQGTSRAQMDLRDILDAPGVNAIALPGNDFLLGNCKEKFDEQGNLNDEGTIKFLNSVLVKFTEWVNTINAVSAEEAADWTKEDLTASGITDTTIDVDMMSKDWVNQAAAKTHAAEDTDYVKLDSGVLSVNQLNWFLKTMPMELTYMDDNDQFIYYNHYLDRDDMLAPRYPWQTGMPMSEVHPQRAMNGVKRVINQLRYNKTDLVKMPVPGNKVNEKWLMHYYKRMADEEGKFRGINEWVLDIWPIVAQYLEMTGQKLVADPNAKVDAHGGASGKPASPSVEANQTDTDAGASDSDSEETSAPVAEPAVDTNAGASGEEEETTTSASPVAKVEPSVDTDAGASSEEDDAANGIPDSVDTDAGASD
ncbi:Flavoprotein [Limosilactobacillus gastricus PS3]|uniref:Flavoprotein n=1 Tax=Limosilactobacillus gastricus PS3 TaxID=1144300 RepID=H4GHW5_9LACO|nr:NAD(P)H-dependent oxidoreductase [Limosilactobacillus gastricus]EHS87521.1 Flavoprotein [Limosilactobacillus gastricus PS3]